MHASASMGIRHRRSRRPPVQMFEVFFTCRSSSPRSVCTRNKNPKMDTTELLVGEARNCWDFARSINNPKMGRN